MKEERHWYGTSGVEKHEYDRVDRLIGNFVRSKMLLRCSFVNNLSKDCTPASFSGIKSFNSNYT